MDNLDDEDLLGYDPHQAVAIGYEDVEEIPEQAGGVGSSDDGEDGEEDLADEEAEPGVGGPDGLPHPAVGMEFPSYQSLLHYYNEYALLVGFEFRRLGLTKTRVGPGEPDYLRLECGKAGEYISKAKNPDYCRRSKKCLCEVMLNARQNKNKPWRITTVINVHNHECKKEDTRHMSTHRRMTLAEERELRLNALVGIPLCKSYALMARRKGGINQMGFSEKDGRNRLNKIRRLELAKGDYEALRYFLARVMRESPNSYSASDMDDEGRLRNVFWADGRSREAYKDFGDVISFDATYMKNRYKMPFCPFIGVNHHGQSILLGCGLISGESTKNYIWLFEQWLNCMGGKAPGGIVTDQSQAICNALQHVFPEIRHRRCLYHIMQNAEKHLKRRLKQRWDRFNSRMKSVMHVTLTVEEFEDEWQIMIADYEMGDNKWLKKIFSIREQWAPIYFKGDFWAGMSSTQRSEGMNNYFRSFMNLDTSLKEFGEQFNEALAKRVEAEAVETFRMNDAPLVCRFEFPMEAIFCNLYTKSKVGSLQKELAGVNYCVVHVRKEKNGVHRYIIQDLCDRCKWPTPVGMFFRVVYRPVTREICCQCHNFEFTGILCRHIVAVFQEGVEDVPARYIVDRWRRDIPRNYLKFSIPGTSPEAMGPEPAIYSSLRDQFEETARVVVANPMLTFEMEAYLRDLHVRGMVMSTSHQGVELVPGDAGVGSIYMKRRGTVCPHPMPVPCYEAVEAPKDGLVGGLEPGHDPVPCRGPGRVPGHRRGYHGGGTSRGGGRSNISTNQGTQVGSTSQGQNDFFGLSRV